jgi:erythromycin esterase
MTAVLLLATLLSPHRPLTRAIEKGAAHTVELRMQRGESADVVVTQDGVDLVVEVLSPTGVLLEAVDSPNGRKGDEVAEVFARESGTYTIRVRPFDTNEPQGSYRVELREQRNVRATNAVLESRRAARAEATEWLRKHISDLATLANRARVIGLGEATHGSREFGDVRLALTRQLVEQHGFRVIFIEASSDEAAQEKAGDWIGTRTRRALLSWVREWNAAHPSEPVRVIGVDAQGNEPSRRAIAALIDSQYRDTLSTRWTAAQQELAAADEQTLVFGNSSISAETRTFVFELATRIALDAPLLRARGIDVDRATQAAHNLATFADFNGNGRSRDWHMAARILRDSNGERAVFWAHNAHVAATRGQTAGALLRSALGCAYAPLAITFAEGSFVAQTPNDAADRLQVSTLRAPADESFESVLAPLGNALISWPCGTDPSAAPPWLRTSHAMRWVGGLWQPRSLASAASRPFDLLHDFDGVVFLPTVTAEDLPSQRPRIPARK